MLGTVRSLFEDNYSPEDVDARNLELVRKSIEEDEISLNSKEKQLVIGSKKLMWARKEGTIDPLHLHEWRPIRTPYTVLRGPLQAFEAYLQEFDFKWYKAVGVIDAAAELVLAYFIHFMACSRVEYFWKSVGPGEMRESVEIRDTRSRLNVQAIKSCKSAG